MTRKHSVNPWIWLFAASSSLSFAVTLAIPQGKGRILTMFCLKGSSSLCPSTAFEGSIYPTDKPSVVAECHEEKSGEVATYITSWPIKVALLKTNNELRSEFVDSPWRCRDAALSFHSEILHKPNHFFLSTPCSPIVFAYSPNTVSV